MIVSSRIITALWDRLRRAVGTNQPRQTVFPDGVLYAIDLHGGPGGGHVLRSDGRIFSWTTLEPGFAPEHEDWRCLQALAIAARTLPELAATLPTRPESAYRCVMCMGTGFTDLRNAPQFVICTSCNGLGWRVSS